MTQAQIAARRRAVALLDELEAAGLIEVRLSSRDLGGPEPKPEIRSRPGALACILDPTLSDAAARLWELLRNGHTLGLLTRPLVETEERETRARDRRGERG